jgi:hypothetical protein
MSFNIGGKFCRSKDVLTLIKVERLDCGTHIGHFKDASGNKLRLSEGDTVAISQPKQHEKADFYD